MSRIGSLASLSAAALTVPAAQAQDRSPPPAEILVLACDGIATNPVGDPTSGSTARKKTGSRSHSGGASRDSDGAGDEDSGAGSTQRAAPARTGRGVPVAFRFEFAESSGRVLYPAAIVPVVHSGDHGGWWQVRDLAVSDDTFSGRILLNFVNHARFTIDRHSGLFNLAGLQANVTGHCAKAEATPRLF